MIICYAEPEKGGEKTEIGVDVSFSSPELKRRLWQY